MSLITRALNALHISYHTSKERGSYRIWFNRTGPGERYDPIGSVEIGTGRRCVGARLRINEDRDSPVSAMLGLGLVSIYLGSESRLAQRVAELARPILGKDFYGRGDATLGAELYGIDGDAIARIYLGSTDDDRGGPSYYWNLKDILLGANHYTKGEGPPERRYLYMPEGKYLIELRKNESTWKRPRWPWKTTSNSYSWEVIAGEDGRKGIPVPGKGENSYDIDEDAIYGGGCPGYNADDALGHILGSAMSSRSRYGGTKWMPEPVVTYASPDPVPPGADPIAA